ncbi:MAG TPA: isoprenylcysteine carboxylmethyltransferase family protein [Gaiellaceae bacterium]|jgi:protein-S-isoprenylcysteine O-methyltransferase Ste14
MKPLPFTQPDARAVFDVLLVLFVALEWRARIRSHGNRDGLPLDRGSKAVVVLTIYAGLLVAFLLAFDLRGASIADARWPVFVVGVVLMAVGIALRQWAILLLGPLFTTDVRVQPGQTVVERGPYRWVRHPAYTGLILFFLGIGLALGNWGSLVVVAVLPTVGLLVRIRVEEQALLETIGEPYRRFAAGRAHLFPGVW